MYLIGNALEQKRFLTVKEVEKYLQTAHYRLIFGVDNQSPYYPPTLLSLGFPDPEKALRAGADKLYLTKEGSVGYTQKLNDLLKCLLRPKLTIEDIIQPLFDLHRAIIVPELPRESKGAFAFPFANNSFSMNQINAVRRLLGHAGISHDRIDFELLANRKDVTRAFNYFKALMRGEAYLFDENASAPAVSGGSQTPPDVRRAEIRFEEQISKFLTELEERSELRKFVMSDGFSNAANIELGGFGDPMPFVTSVRESLLNAMLPKAFAAETVDPVIAKIVPDKMKALNATLEQVKGRLTIALDLGTLSGAMGQFMEIPVEGTAPVNEIGVTGVLDGGTRDLLRTRGITVRTVEPKRNFISRNQTQVPYVTSNFSVETLSDIFDPILADQITTGDVSAQCYRDRFLIVAAIHLADIRRGGKAMSLSEIRDELLRRLNLKEQDALIHIRGRGFAVSSAAVETYLRMQAEKSIQKAA